VVLVLTWLIRRDFVTVASQAVEAQQAVAADEKVVPFRGKAKSAVPRPVPAATGTDDA
jgi:hypothetical protein